MKILQRQYPYEKISDAGILINGFSTRNPNINYNDDNNSKGRFIGNGLPCMSSVPPAPLSSQPRDNGNYMNAINNNHNNNNAVTSYQDSAAVYALSHEEKKDVTYCVIDGRLVDHNGK
jgi:hypothetical protein